MTDVQIEVSKLSPHPKRKTVSHNDVSELRETIRNLHDRIAECEKRIDLLTKKRVK